MAKWSQRGCLFLARCRAPSAHSQEAFGSQRPESGVTAYASDVLVDGSRNVRRRHAAHRRRCRAKKARGASEYFGAAGRRSPFVLGPSRAA
jgi:hypothetical protein